MVERKEDEVTELFAALLAFAISKIRRTVYLHSVRF